MDDGKTLKYVYGFKQFADNSHEKNLSIAELYGQSDFIQKKLLDVLSVTLILLMLTRLLMNVF